MSKIPFRRQKGLSWKIRLAGTVASLILLIWLLIQQDWTSIIDAIADLPIWIVLISALLIILRQAIYAFRWFLLVRAQGISLMYVEALKMVYSGLFVSNFLPSMVGGDVVKIAGLLQKTENRVAGTASVVVDRILGAIGMLVALPFSLPLIKSLFSSNLFWGGFIIGIKPRIPNFLRAPIERLSLALKLWASQPERLFAALLASWTGMFLNFVAIWLLAQGLGMSVTLTEVVGASALSYYITIIPLSINGYGIRELTIVVLYTQLGAMVEQSSALALLSRFIYLIVSLLGALWVGEILKSEGQDEIRDAEEAAQ